MEHLHCVGQNYDYLGRAYLQFFTFIFAVLLHFCSCYVCSGYVVRGTVYVIRIIFEVLP